MGFAWTLGENEATVIRGGVGYLYSPTLPMTVRQAVNHPTIPYRVVYNRTESAARNVRWPMYTDDALPLAQADSAGRPAVFSLIDTNIARALYDSVNGQRAARASAARWPQKSATSGPMATISRCSVNLLRRSTDRPVVRPNPAIGAPGGYYVDSSQTMVYNGLQTSLRRRFSNRYSWDVNYTLGKSDSTQGGDLSVYYITSFNTIQDFWDPEFDYGPSTNDIRHRLNASFIYELPGIGGGQGVLNGLWGLAAFRHRSGAIGRRS